LSLSIPLPALGSAADEGRQKAEREAAERKLPPPTTFGPISLDASDFPFTYYLRQLQSKISQSWAPPRAATAGGERAIVVFEIGRDGLIKEPALEKSSGNAIYDQSAIRAVMEASPFPPLPPEFRRPSLRIRFGFEFRPEQQ